MVTIHETAQELRRVVLEHMQKIQALPDAELDAKPLPHKWSKKEVVGHLIDSAQNNLRRFICGQYEPAPPHILYDQEFWVKANGYANLSKTDILQLWKLTNERICAVLETMPSENYGKVCDTGRGSQQLHSLEWLAEDYVKHLKHHLNQVVPGSFHVVYP